MSISPPVPTAPPGRRVRRRRSKWIVLLALLLILGAGINLVPRVVESVSRLGSAILSGVVQIFAQAAKAAAEAAYGLAQAELEANPEVLEALGPPLVYPGVEAVQWKEPSGANRLEFEFDVTGQKAPGRATTVVDTSDGKTMRLSTLQLELEDGRIIKVPVP